ncbi:MAG: peptidase M23, partial [Bacteroidetes bacterium]|nr:peptidase M23 [Bacteroidota bacterium]
VTSVFITGAVFTSCSSPEKKVENAETGVLEANQDLDQANAEYLADVETYRKETAEKIAANNQSIAEFNARIENEKKEAKADYKKKIAELEQKNTDMQKRMDDYKVDGKDKWETFKAEFSHDMDQLGDAFKGLTVKNVK